MSLRTQILIYVVAVMAIVFVLVAAALVPDRLMAERKFALSLGRDEGLTKVLFDDATHRAIGCGIVGPSAGDLIAEAALAIELGADAEDIGLTIHPHPTLSETVAMAAEAFEGTITDLYMPKRH